MIDRDTYEIELDVDDGEPVPVTLEEPGMLSKLRVVGKAPDLETMDDAKPHLGEGVDEFIVAIIDEVSDFPTELLDELPKKQFTKLLKACSTTFEGDDPTEIGDDFRHDSDEGSSVFDNLDLDEDGTLDPDDWR